MELLALSGAVRQVTRRLRPVREIFLEPLLVCMVAGFVVSNFGVASGPISANPGARRPAVYLAFFTLAGASLELDTLLRTWGIALLLIAVRTAAVLVGAWAGGSLAGDPARLNRIGWMALLTQAGIGLGLAKEVASEFPEWGGAFATTIIAVIVVNQLIGPPLCKWAVQLSGEARVRADENAGSGSRRAFVFGMEGESLALSRRLSEHGWKVTVATRKELPPDHGDVRGVEMVRLPDFGSGTLREAGAGDAGAWVGLLSSEDNLELCERAYGEFGISNVVVRVAERPIAERCQELGAVVVDPGVAMVNLLDHFVRSPSLAGVLVGMDADQDTIEVRLENDQYAGAALRDIRLPLDVLIVAVRRKGAMLISHGYTRLELGDRLTVVGSRDSLDRVEAELGG
ncbi:MAG: TrkA C-terminal domain-containing protein [Thermoanaerobaculia bacterium]